MNARTGLMATTLFLLLVPTAHADFAYEVKRGDVLERIAKRNKITVAELKSANGLPEGKAGDAIKPGQVLIIPEFPEDDGLPSMTSTYRVVKGDWLSKIARRFNTTVKWLKATNGLTSNTIRPKQLLKVPGPGGMIDVYATPPKFEGVKWQEPMTVSRADLTVLARIVKGECDARVSREGMVAVAAVVLNRVRSTSYKNTITGVAHAPAQFSSYDRPRRQSHYYGTIPQYAWDAARAALAGEDPTHGSTVFFNPEIVRSGHPIRKTVESMQFVKRIGKWSYDSHVFYRVRPNRVLERREREAIDIDPRTRDRVSPSRRGMIGHDFQ